MKHLSLTTKTLPRKAAAHKSCCDCLDQWGDNREKCDALGKCVPGTRYVCL